LLKSFLFFREIGVGLSPEQSIRYDRHIILDQVGKAGQEKLLESKVLIVGAGGLGSPAAMYLAGAGVGTIGIVDADKVELSNLQRQIIHGTGDVGVDKVVSAEHMLAELNPDVTVQVYNILVEPGNIGGIVEGYDLVLDCTDNFAAKFLINDACYFEKKAFCHAGVLKFDGQLMTVLPDESSCYRCVFDSPPDEKTAISCSRAGVLGVLPGVIGSLQATEAIKYLLEIGELLTDTMLTYNALTMEFRKVKVKRNPNCPLCGEKPTITNLYTL
jgi:molybdopterin-synthase adenylyltransferase